MRSKLVLILFVILIPASMFAQEPGVGFGITYTQSTEVYEGYDYYGYYRNIVTDDVFRLTMPIRANETVVIEPSFAMVRVQAGDNNRTSVDMGAMFRIHPFDNAVPFIGAHLKVHGLGLGSKMQMLTVGPVLGGEYFFDDNFSLGAELRIDIFQTIWDHPSDRLFYYHTYGGISVRYYL